MRNKMSWFVCAVALVSPDVGGVFAASNTLTIPESVVTGNAQYTLDIQQSNEWWSAGHVPQTGESIVFTRDGSKTPYLKHDMTDLTISNLTVNAQDFYLKGTKKFIFDADSSVTVGVSSGMLKLNAPVLGLCPVLWSASEGLQLLADSSFGEPVTLTGTMHAGNPGTLGMGGTSPKITMGDLLGWPNTTAGGAYVMLKQSATLVATNTSSFAGVVALKEATFGTFGGEDTLNVPTADAELVTDGLLAHFDATDLSTLTFTNGNRLAEWRDRVSGLKAVPLYAGQFPWYNENALGTNALVHFGGASIYVGPSGKNYTAPLKFETALATAQTVFYLMDTSLGGGWLLPTTTDSRNFHRGTGVGNQIAGVWASDNYNTGVTFRQNGVTCDITKTHPTGTYDILALTRDGAAFKSPIAGFAFDYVTANLYERVGRQRIGEFIAYNRKLSDDEIGKVERYLYRKWLAGRGALRQVSVINSGTLDVGESVRTGFETHVQHLNARGVVRKTGAGTVVLDRPRELADRIDLAAGTLAIENTNAWPRLDGVVANLPTDGMILRLDASDATTVTTNEAGDVIEWRDLSSSGNKLVRGVDGTTVGAYPFRRPSAFNGKWMVDFGGLNTVSFMNLATRITTARTVLYVCDARYGGSHLLSDVSTTQTAGAGGTSYHRSGLSSQVMVASYDLTAPFVGSGNQAQEVWVNGEPVDGLRLSPQGVPQVVIFTGRHANCIIGRIGMDRSMTDRSSGLAVGELVVYNRVLSNDELAQANAYLRAKWLDATQPAVRAVRATGDATLEARVPLTVGTLSGAGRIAAKGEKITVKGLADFTGSLGSGGGVWDIRHDNGAAPTANPVTAGLLAHFDPSDAMTVTTNVSGGVTGIVAKNDATLVATPKNASYAPTLRAASTTMNSSSDTSCGKKGVLDCGSYTTSNPRGLQMSSVFTNVHTVIAVIGGHYPTAGLFGSSTVDTPFSRSNDRLAAGALITGGTTGAIWGEGWINGRHALPWVDVGYNGYQILSFVWPRRMPLDQLGYVKKAGSAGGGQVYGEVLMWNRCLTDAERKSVEAYLSAKWFGKAIHGYTVEGTSDVSGFDTAGEPAALTVDEGEMTHVAYVVGDGGLEKTGAGALVIDGSTATLTGDLTVKEGTLALPETMLDADTLPVTDGLLAHFDAGKGIETNATGAVTSWASQAGAAPYGTYAATAFKTSTEWPKLVTDGLNGHAWIDFGPFGKGSGLWFDPTVHADAIVKHAGNDYGTIPGCQTIVMMFNAERGGGFVVGNLGDYYYHRDGTTPTGGKWCEDYAAPVFEGSTAGGLSVYSDTRYSSTRASYALTNGWQVLEISKSSYNNMAGFAHDRCVSYPNERSGGQGVAEAICYNRVLSSEERIKLRAYLYHKYRDAAAPQNTTLRGMYADAPRAGTLTVKPGATFDLNGYEQHVGTLVCAGGTVTDGDLKVTGSIAYVPGETLTVNGTVSFGETGTIVVPEGTPAGAYRLIAAADVVLPNPNGWATHIVIGEKKRIAFLAAVGHDVWMRLADQGTCVILR